MSHPSRSGSARRAFEAGVHTLFGIHSTRSTPSVVASRYWVMEKGWGNLSNALRRTHDTRSRHGRGATEGCSHHFERGSCGSKSSINSHGSSVSCGMGCMLDPAPLRHRQPGRRRVVRMPVPPFTCSNHANCLPFVQLAPGIATASSIIVCDEVAAIYRGLVISIRADY
jgi:hypothetical protein